MLGWRAELETPGPMVLMLGNVLVWPEAGPGVSPPQPCSCL